MMGTRLFCRAVRAYLVQDVLRKVVRCGIVHTVMSFAVLERPDIFLSSLIHQTDRKKCFGDTHCDTATVSSLHALLPGVTCPAALCKLCFICH